MKPECIKKSTRAHEQSANRDTCKTSQKEAQSNQSLTALEGAVGARFFRLEVERNDTS